MPTNYLLKPDGTLIHGHPMGSTTDRVQWHVADTYHRIDAHVHDRERCWTDLKWSSQNYALTSREKDDLVLKAFVQHERNARADNYYTYKPSTAPHPRAVLTDGRYNKADAAYRQPAESEPIAAPAPVADNTPAPVKEPEPAPAPAPATAAPATAAPAPKIEIYEEQISAPSLEDLEERVGNLEELSLQQLPEVDKKLVKLLQSGDEHKRELVHLGGEIARLEKKQPDLTEALAPLAARIEIIERAQARKIEYTVHTPEKTIVTKGRQHKAFDDLLALTLSLDPWDRNLWMCGPAGSGKTQLAHSLADALELSFDFSAALDSGYKITGHKDANSHYVSTPFYRQYKDGGVMLLDEVDFSNPAALSEINAATSNGLGSFPEGLVPRHNDFILCCAANTWGLGGDAVYVGTARQNAASLDRFITVEVDYDEDLEREIAGQGDPISEEWVTVVQECRKSAFSNGGVQMVISPRASLKGAQLLRRGVSRELVVRALFGKYRKHTSYDTVFAPALRWASRVKPASSADTYFPKDSLGPNGYTAPVSPTAERIVSRIKSVDFSRTSR